MSLERLDPYDSVPDPFVTRHERLSTLASWAYKMTYGQKKEIHQEGRVVMVADGDYDGHWLVEPDPLKETHQMVRAFYNKFDDDIDGFDVTQISYVADEVFAVERREVMRPGPDGQNVHEIEWDYDLSIDYDDKLINYLYQHYCANYLLDHLAEL